MLQPGWAYHAAIGMYICSAWDNSAPFKKITGFYQYNKNNFGGEPVSKQIGTIGNIKIKI